jgi:hypothetical protein
MIQCPKCNSLDIIIIGKLYYFLVGMGLIGVGMWLMNFTLLCAGLTGSGLLFLAGAIITKKEYTCENCGYHWDSKNCEYVEETLEEVA